MREILFRAKTVHNPEWVEGYYTKRDVYYITGFTPNVPIIADEDGNWDEIDPKTLGEFIGRRDKNGKKMFEGDIIKSVIGNIIVIFKACGFMGEVIGKQFYYDLYDDNLDSVEVIGNIYDNPELLEGIK